MHNVASIIGIVLSVSLTGCAWLGRSVSERFLQPRAEWFAQPSDLGLQYEDVVIATGEDSTVHGWFIPAQHGDGRTVLLCHGNAANISFYHPYYRFLHAAGWNVLLYDYRGFGKSQGERDVGALFSDTEAMLDHAMTRPDVDRRKVALFGLSLGAIVALRTAAHRPEIAAVVVENAASPHEALGRALGSFFGWLVSALALPGGMEPDANAAGIGCPQLFLCGAWDNELLAHLRAFHAVRGPAACWVMPATGHAPNSLLVHDGEYQDAIVRFLDAAVAGAVPRIEVSTARLRDGVLIAHLVRRELSDTGPLAVEVCVVDPEGRAEFTQRWMFAADETWELAGVDDPAAVTAWCYRRVAGTPESGFWSSRPGPLAQAERARATLVSFAGTVAASPHPLRDAQSFLGTLAELEGRAPLPPLLQTELIPAYLVVGRALATSPGSEDRKAARSLLQRCVAAAPACPGLHYWPGLPYTAGFTHQAEVDAARSLLLQLDR